MESHRVIQHDNIYGAGQCPHRAQSPFLYFYTEEESQHCQANTQQQHALLGIRDNHQKVEQP
ncbi:Uncharacterised protein [Shigella sonnei]|nr:Uncharacterised protein [Shigella sonnei]CSE89985.1 Uncharacterised protein [Shigella sonnei]CSF47682.1 Uncharacterised protein [Shigella sonnei]CSF70199.1 Uncharacterised protein [Shigella sonnei]CSF92021.1 Uncharacterised protein [Shigella sonnei]